MSPSKNVYASRVLLVGVITSFLLLATGLVMHTVSPVPETTLHLRELGELWRPDHLGSVGVIHLGLVVLMLTPFVRVLVLIGEFIRAREIAFVMISVAVLLLLITGVTIGLA